MKAENIFILIIIAITITLQTSIVATTDANQTYQFSPNEIKHARAWMSRNRKCANENLQKFIRCFWNQKLFAYYQKDMSLKLKLRQCLFQLKMMCRQQRKMLLTLSYEFQKKVSH